MRQTIVPTNEFNKELFSDLLKKVKGQDKIVVFSKNCGVSPAFMGKYLNCTFEKPPAIGTIQRISTYTELFGITFEMLAKAAGYSEIDIEATKNNTSLFGSERSFDAIIMSALSRKGFEWKFIPIKDATSSANFLISLDMNYLDQWGFMYYWAFDNFQYSKRGTIIDPTEKIFNKLLFSSFPENSKMSIVTNSEELFQRLIHYKPKMLAMYLSVILIDVRDSIVLDEVYLETALSNDNNWLTKYTLK